MSIDPIKLGASGIGSGYGRAKKSDIKKEEAKKPEANLIANDKATVKADDVLSFMAQSAASVKPKTIDTTKYVDKESEKRIAGFMADFEDKVAEGLKAFDQEFAGIDVSDSTKMAVVLKQVEQKVS